MVDVARALGISYTAFRQKIYNVRQFKVTEIQMLCKMLEIEDKDKYFFAGMQPKRKQKKGENKNAKKERETIEQYQPNAQQRDRG